MGSFEFNEGLVISSRRDRRQPNINHKNTTRICSPSMWAPALGSKGQLQNLEFNTYNKCNFHTVTALKFLSIYLLWFLTPPFPFCTADGSRNYQLYSSTTAPANMGPANGSSSRPTCVSAFTSEYVQQLRFLLESRQPALLARTSQSDAANPRHIRDGGPGTPYVCAICGSHTLR